MCKTLLCAIAKCENQYIMEWIAWHLELGFDKIVIYDNNDINGEKITDVVGNLQNVEIVNWRGKAQGCCEVQVKAYNDCYRRYRDHYDWVAFFDIDEFLEFKGGMKLKEYLSQEWIKNANAIKFHWKCYSDNGHLKKPEGLVTENYTQECEDKSVNRYVKTIYRGGIAKLNIVNVHYSNKIGNVFMQNGVKVISESTSTYDNINYSYGWIRHYVTKSLEEFVKIKYARRRPGTSKTRLSSSFYFKYNKRTPEKEQLFDSLMNANNNTTNNTTSKSVYKNKYVGFGYGIGYGMPIAKPKKNVEDGQNYRQVIDVPVCTPQESKHSIVEGISVCITAWNTQDYIEECLDSVERQTWFKTHNNWEVIVGIDGCKKTLEKVKSIMHKYRNLKVLMMDSNKGTYVTSNTIMKESKYEWLLRFDSDDIMCDNMIESLMKEKSDADVVRITYKNFGENNKEGLAWGVHFFKKAVFNKYGGYRDWECSGDYDFLYRIEPDVKTVKLSDVFFNRRVHSDSLEFCEATNMKSDIRKARNSFVVAKSRNDKTIKCVTNTFSIVTDNTVKGIISLTSWKARINFVYKTIESLLDKTKNFKIVLVLSEEEFPKKEKELPQTITRLLSDRFEILWVYKNYKAFKKVLFTMEKYPSLPVISADDDIVCLADYATLMYNEWCKDKESFVTSKSHSFNRVLLPVKSEIKHTAGCCTLYPPKVFKNYGMSCLTDDVLKYYEDDTYYSALKYYLGLNKCTVLPDIANMYSFTEADSIEPLRNIYIDSRKKERRKLIFDITRQNMLSDIMKNTTVLVANFNVSTFTQNMIKSIRKQLGFDIHITILDNSITTPWDYSITNNVDIIDNTNFKHTNDYNQPSLNHGYAIDYALKHIDKEWVILCDCDILFKPNVKELFNFTHKDFDICGEIGHDVMPKDRLFPYFCIINNKKLKDTNTDFFDEQTDLNKGYDTGYSLLTNAKKHNLKIKTIKISDYIFHLKGGVLRNKDYKSWFEIHKDLF